VKAIGKANARGKASGEAADGMESNKQWVSLPWESGFCLTPSPTGSLLSSFPKSHLFSTSPNSGTNSQDDECSCS
jgi:hypothetical protein